LLAYQYAFNEESTAVGVSTSPTGFFYNIKNLINFLFRIVSYHSY